LQKGKRKVVKKENFLYDMENFFWRTFGEAMSREKDEEITIPGIKPREHFMRPSGIRGRTKYPFKGMIVGDYFRVDSWDQALHVRAALRSFYKRKPGRQFTVRQNDEGWWVCRRVA
jgi:hypothetical protein